MQFNYIENMISQSPLDFNYKFGINDNSPDKFRCNNITIMSKNLNTDSVKSYVNQSYQLDLFNGLDNEESYEYDISNVDNGFSEIDNISMLSLEKKDTVSSDNSLVKTVFTSILSSISGGEFSNINNIVSYNSKLSQGFALTNNLVNFGLNVFNLAQTINQSKDMYNATKYSINSQIELLNERTEANREFIQSLKDRQEQNKQKYVSKSKNMV